jgi:hypothetical protein
VKDNLTIHILPAGQDIGQMEFYMEVDDIDGLWSLIKDKVAGLRACLEFHQLAASGKFCFIRR